MTIPKYTSIQSILSAHSIDYRDSGKNVSYGFITITCPKCDDPSMHMNINIKDRFYRCFRCGEHGDWIKLNKMLKTKYNVDTSSIMDTGNLFEEKKKEKHIKTLHLRPLNALDTNSKQYKFVMNYLTAYPTDMKNPYRTRGFAKEVIEYIKPYVPNDDGDMKEYVFFKDRENFQGRKMVENGGGSKWHDYVPNKPILLGLEQMERMKPKTLYICEGIFDMLSLPLGQAVASLTSIIKEEQISLMMKKNPNLENVMFCFDRGVNPVKSMEILESRGINCSTLDWENIKEDYKDVDEYRLKNPTDFIVKFKLGGINK